MIANSTISNTKNNKEKILRFKQEMQDVGMSKKTKVMKLRDDIRHGKAVYLWFQRKRMEGIPL